MDGAVCLTEVLENNRVLEHLSLNKCDIGDDGMESLAGGKINSQFCSCL